MGIAAFDVLPKLHWVGIRADMEFVFWQYVEDASTHNHYYPLGCHVCDGSVVHPEVDGGSDAARILSAILANGEWSSQQTFCNLGGIDKVSIRGIDKALC